MALETQEPGRDGKAPLRPSPFSDAAILGRIRSGETEAFGALVQKYQARLMSQMTRRVRDTETAKDLSQEVWLRAYRGISSFRGDSGFYSWLYRIAENLVIDHFRQQRDTHEPLHSIDEGRLIAHSKDYRIRYNRKGYRISHEGQWSVDKFDNVTAAVQRYAIKYA